MGASKGEGLGNKFLSHIRSRCNHTYDWCFDSYDIQNVNPTVDPIRALNYWNWNNACRYWLDSKKNGKK